MKRWTGWHAVLVLAALGLALLGYCDLGDCLADQERLALSNILILAGFGAAGFGTYRVLSGERVWHRRVQAWTQRPMTHWNDWRIIGLLGGIAFGLYFLGVVDLPPADKWSSAGVLLLLAVCLAVQMINVAFFRKRDRR